MIATKNIRGLLVTNAFLKNGKFVEHYEWLREAARQPGDPAGSVR